MTSRVNLTINGQKIEAHAGQTVLEVAQEHGIDIPTLCHHPALEPVGSCRMCLIEISRHQPLYPACTYQVSEGLAVQTDSPRVESARRFVLELIFSERNHYCMFCEMSGNCELQDLGYRYGLDHWLYPTYLEPFPVDATPATFLLDHNRCVLCRRCVRACSELVANHTLGMRQRGAATMVSADLNAALGDSSCVECGTCVQVCPTGALVDKRSAYMDMGRNARIERVPSICTQCSMGCGLEFVLRDGQLVRVDGNWDAAPNGGVLCKKGRFDPLFDERQRITVPLIRSIGRLESTNWDHALGIVASRLGSAPADRLGILTSTQASLEALHLLGQLFRGKLSVPNATLLNPKLPMRLQPQGKLADLQDSDLILVIGADPVVEQPVASFLIRRAMDKGARLVVVDGARNELALLGHMVFCMDDLDQALEVAERAESPVVLYGTRVAEAEIAEWTALRRAKFIGLEPGVNSSAAVAFGLENGFAAERVETLYVLLGDQPWQGERPVIEGAFVAVQAGYESPLTERADVVLPTAIWCERVGTFANLEGAVQQANPALPPEGEARQDWEVLSMLAERLGQPAVPAFDALSNLAVQALNGKEGG